MCIVCRVYLGSLKRIIHWCVLYLTVETAEESPDTLPSYDTLGEDNNCSDVSLDKKMDKQEAVVYCTVCSSKFCEKHVMSYDDDAVGRQKISVEGCKSQAIEMRTRNCTKHEDQPYFVGCKLCLNLVCRKCLADLDKCDIGASHNLLSLEDLVAALMKEEISAEMLAKEEQYEKLFKKASRARSAYDNKTAEMIELIHTIGDAQVRALKPKYKKLEEKMTEKRQKSSVAIAEFMEDFVLRKWTQLKNHRKALESRVRCSHQVDVVNGIKELKEEMQKFVEEELPKLHLRDEVLLKILDVNGGAKLQVVSSCDILIDSELPQAMKLLKSVPLRGNPLSVCHYNESTCIGSDLNTVTRIDNNYRLHNSFIITSGEAEAITAYKDRFYTLSKAYNPRVVSVYDMSGVHLASWTHPWHLPYSNTLAVIADQVVVADPANQRITVYSLTGESLRHIPCPLLSNGPTYMCAVDNTSVVISNNSTNIVFRVDMTTGEVMWTLSDVKDPQASVRYGGYILLAAREDNTIYILNTRTGKIVAEMADDAISGNVYSMAVYGTTLVVPLCRLDKRVVFYQLDTT